MAADETAGTGVLDSVLARRAAGGDRAAFDRLVRKHTPAMYRVALRVLGNASDAEDVVQDAWLSAWRALPAFRAESAVSTWLYRIVTNAALGVVRRRKATVSLEAGLEDGPRTDLQEALATDVDAGPESRAVSAEELAAVLRAIDSLEVSQRLPLVLHELEGLSYEEISDVLNVSVEALRSRLYRARVTLLRRLKECR